jgi:hypothetical protein
MTLKTTFGMTIAGVLLAGLMTGCGDSDRVAVVKAAGKVTLDGKAHGPASLTFTPTGGGADDKRPVVGGVVAKDGTFTLTTYETGDGAPPGEYSVALGPDTSDAASTDPDKMMATMSGGPSADSVTVTVPDGGTDSLKLDFKSTAKKKGPKDKLLGT